MSIKVFSKRLNWREMFGLQKLQYNEKLLMSAIVPANSQTLAKTTVSNLGHFLCLFITGRFTTLASITDAKLGTVTIDTGISYLRGLLTDGSGQKRLFNDYIPLDLLLSPGRTRSALAGNTYVDLLDTSVSPSREVALASATGQTLFYPQEFEYLFSANSEIQFDVKNASNVANQFDIVFHGIRILSGAAVRGVA
jgi:hypothetical protein